MEETPKQEAMTPISKKHFTAIPQDWETMTPEQQDAWTENFLVGSGLFPAPTQE